MNYLWNIQCEKIDRSGTFHSFFKDLMTILKKWKFKISKIQNCNDLFFHFSVNVQACLEFVDGTHKGGKKGIF